MSEQMTKHAAQSAAERRKAECAYEEWLREVWAEQARDRDADPEGVMSEALRVVQDIEDATAYGHA